MIFKILTGRLICQVVPMFAFPSQQRRALRSKVHSKYSQLIGDDSQKNFVSMLVVCLDYLYHEILVNEVMTLGSSAWQNKAINEELLDDWTSKQRWRLEGGKWEMGDGRSPQKWLLFTLAAGLPSLDRPDRTGPPFWAPFSSSLLSSSSTSCIVCSWWSKRKVYRTEIVWDGAFSWPDNHLGDKMLYFFIRVKIRLEKCMYAVLIFLAGDHDLEEVRGCKRGGTSSYQKSQ